MAKAKKKSGKDVKPKKEPEQEPQAPEPEPPKSEASEPEKNGSSQAMKLAAIVVLLIVAGSLAIYFILQPANRFVPGTQVSQETFLNIFESSENVIIFMDVRGIPEQPVRKNVMQCGVDFAGSSGLATKNVTFFSLGDEGCIVPTGPATDEYCFGELKNALTIYVQDAEGESYHSYHSNGLIVAVNESYQEGTCGIHRS